MRRLLTTLAALAIVSTSLAAGADTPYPVVEEPVLRPDSQWTQTAWGYKHASLTFPAGPRTWPTQLTMEGYAGATRPAPNAYLRMDDGALMALRIRFGDGPRGDYALVQASIRGTECSGGSFNLYDRRHAWDGYHIVEWIAAQPWSNQAVGMYGSSFPGQTAYWVATTRPPHLKAVSANLLHSDIYRDIFMPGGVQNILFPSLWTYAAGPHRAPQDAARNRVFESDEICAQHQASRYNAGDLPQPQNEPIWAGVRSVDDDWYTAHAALTYAGSITIPFYLQNNWQDEQVGPRSVVLWHHINPDPVTITDRTGSRKTIVPKKFVLSNGDHGHGNFASRDRWDFFDIFLLDRPDVNGLMDEPVVNYFEANNDGSSVATKSGASWPFPGTTWTQLYLHGDTTAGFDAPTGAEATQTYASGAARQNYLIYAGSAGQGAVTPRGLPDQVEYTTEPLDADMAVAGPILMDLYASMAGTDADFFVSINEVWPDGRTSYLQRGLLKASHRRIDPLRSYYVDDGGSRRMVQPYRPHTNPQPVMPGEVLDYRIEIFPLGHIFRKGNRIQIKVHTPPTVDGIWGYTPTHHQAAAVTIHHGADTPTRVQLPVVTPDGGSTGVSRGCQVPGGFPCYDPPVATLD